MIVINCKGSPYEIGRQHGEGAKQQIKQSIAFYSGLFETTSQMKWNDVQEVAKTFASTVKQKWPSFYEEIRGVAHGSQRDVLEIVALNVRTEIAFGRFSDGCTSLAWHTNKNSFLSQNWDWKEAQKENLIVLKIQKEGVPDIQMITEAGLIGKIGFNSRGVGVCLNAIKAKGVDMQRIPVHLALRLVLESQTAADAVQQLEKFGVGSSAHILIADPQTAVGMEVSSTTIEKLAADSRGVLSHTNHFKLQHAGVVDARLLEDSEPRDARMQQLAAGLEVPSREGIFTLFQDEQNAPSAICRQEIGDSTLATLFNIIMDLREKKAEICLGRPLKVDERLTLSF